MVVVHNEYGTFYHPPKVVREFELGEILVTGEWNEETYYWNGKEFVCVTTE